MTRPGAEETLRRAMLAVLAEAEAGYPDALHVMPFPRAQGFQVETDTQAGDVFQRAVLMETLAAIHAAELADLSGLMAREAAYLMSRRIEGPPGGWRYFPDLSELPPDADDLAQVIRALIWAGERELARTASREPLEVLLCQGRSGPGRYETWIVPALDTEEIARQRWWIENAWGRGADCEVLANLVIALTGLDPVRYAQVIADCRTEIGARQGPDGAWPSTWYHGPYYPGRICARALGAQTRAAARWRDWLAAHQNPDGGWGVETGSDAQSTGLAMLSLGPDDPRAARGVAFLIESQEADGLWPGVFWIRMELGRAQGAPHTIVRYGSRVIGAGYALQALIARSH